MTCGLQLWEALIGMLLSGRDVLRGHSVQADPIYMRPFGADPARFDDLCRDCSACLSACPEGIIVTAADGRAAVDLRRGACNFCQACAQACPTGALRDDNQTWDWHARIDTQCLSIQGISCRACQDVCEPRAISFRLATAGRAMPQLELDSCTGCSGACPADAIRFDHRPQKEEEAAG